MTFTEKNSSDNNKTPSLLLFLPSYSSKPYTNLIIKKIKEEEEGEKRRIDGEWTISDREVYTQVYTMSLLYIFDLFLQSGTVQTMVEDLHTKQQKEEAFLLVGTTSCETVQVCQNCTCCGYIDRVFSLRLELHLIEAFLEGHH